LQIFDVVLTGLTPATRYFYRYGSDADGWSAEASFVTAPEIGAVQYPLKILTFGGTNLFFCNFFISANIVLLSLSDK
jgi:hypothetical protein